MPTLFWPLMYRASVKKFRYYNPHIGFRWSSFRIWCHNSDVIIRWWRHNTLPTLFLPLMYRQSFKKFRYYNPSIGYRWWAFRIWCQHGDVIIRWWRHNTLPTLYWPLMYSAVLKSQDFIISLKVIDCALSESEVRIVTLSFLDDVITHCKHYIVS